MNAGATEQATVLLVDDCIGERDLYEITLAPEFQVLTATRGTDAVELAKSAHPKAIVLDVLMPGIDGWETCTRLKSHPSTADIPVILLSGCTDRDLSQHAVAVGAAAILTKPCPADRLIAHLHSVIDDAHSPTNDC